MFALTNKELKGIVKVSDTLPYYFMKGLHATD